MCKGRWQTPRLSTEYPLCAGWGGGGNLQRRQWSNKLLMKNQSMFSKNIIYLSKINPVETSKKFPRSHLFFTKYLWEQLPLTQEKRLEESLGRQIFIVCYWVCLCGFIFVFCNDSNFYTFAHKKDISNVTSPVRIMWKGPFNFTFNYSTLVWVVSWEK
jgi:hypothetical protein